MLVSLPPPFSSGLVPETSFCSLRCFVVLLSVFRSRNPASFIDKIIFIDRHLRNHIKITDRL